VITTWLLFIGKYFCSEYNCLKKKDDKIKIRDAEFCLFLRTCSLRNLGIVSNQKGSDKIPRMPERNDFIHV
jgi:hypothetical protein